MGTIAVPMGRALSPRELEGTLILDRRFEGGALKIVPAPGEEVTVVCDCGGSHWLAAVRSTGTDAYLTLYCHRCRSRYELPYRGSTPRGR